MPTVASFAERVGIQKRPATLYELDESYLEAPTEEELEVEVLASGAVG